MATIKSDRQWEAECDARDLARANEITSDPKRLLAAKKAAIKLAKEDEKRANAMKKVVSKPIRKRGK